MTEEQRDASKPQVERARILLTGLGLGALVGLLSSYLYARAAEENVDAENGMAASISTGQALAVALAVLGVVRQIAALGKPDKKRRK
ncbi:MAG: hypothetical protein OXG92_03305 [Chloroflexi bacterium]|nr:hypothetical protein [Chloroflexota bacterium]MCY3582761.1 hypothetical protein [Chloroflexota bacterium]MCY3715480.1 hypothetical protein [Chloroflexota bacterium]MDE2650288.1 hypothetical protein [Chloroflexota bacterium]MXV92334.1 hypothetical protein [Chloroflexota bacterium]